MKLFGRYREFDKAIKSRYDGLASYEQEIINEENVLCKTHLNVLLLEDDETILNRQTEQVKMIFTNAGFKYYIPSYEGLYNIFIGSIIGRENNLNPDYLFLSDLHSSLCMGINYSTFRSDKEGILFNERLYQTPIRKDVWDADKKRIPARNMIIVASTGGGKSVTSLNIIQQNISRIINRSSSSSERAFTSFRSCTRTGRCILIMTAAARWGSIRSIRPGSSRTTRR